MVKSKSKSLKSTIKFLSRCKDPRIISEIISKSPDNVIKTICNAALNAAQGEVPLTRKQKRVLSANRPLISKLIQKGESAKSKKKLLTQTGGSIIVPAILSAVLAALGSRLFK